MREGGKKELSNSAQREKEKVMGMLERFVLVSMFLEGGYRVRTPFMGSTNTLLIISVI